MIITFTKMQGLGNDFVVLDATVEPFNLSALQIQTMANRRLGIGFDQLLVLEQPQQAGADFHFRIFNADGSEVYQCGNGARCAAVFIKEQKLTTKNKFVFSVGQDTISLVLRADNKVAVNMGVPTFKPAEIPFICDEQKRYYKVDVCQQSVPLSVVNIGNPHAIIEVKKIITDEVKKIGLALNHHPLFPEGINVGFMQVIDPQHICLRVYERGAGETLACGSGASAAMVVGRRNGLLQERVYVKQPGGNLTIDWQGPNQSILMVGPAKTVFSGQYRI